MRSLTAELKLLLYRCSCYASPKPLVLKGSCLCRSSTHSRLAVTAAGGSLKRLCWAARSAPKTLRR